MEKSKKTKVDKSPPVHTKECTLQKESGWISKPLTLFTTRPQPLMSSGW